MADDTKNGPPKSKRAPGTLVTAQLYEQMWVVYRDGERTINELRDRFGIHWDTAKKAIEVGWPDRGMQALRARARELDQLRAEAERTAALDKHREATDAWYRAGKTFNKAADHAANAAMLALQQIAQLTTVRGEDGQVRLRPLTKWVKRRTTEVVDGKRVHRTWDEEVPLTTAEAIRLQAMVLKALESASKFKQEWPVKTDEQKAITGPPTGISALTLEEMDYIIEHGQLPPGKTAEDVFGYDVPGFQKPKGKGPN